MSEDNAQTIAALLTWLTLLAIVSLALVGLMIVLVALGLDAEIAKGLFFIAFALSTFGTLKLVALASEADE